MKCKLTATVLAAILSLSLTTTAEAGPESATRIVMERTICYGTCPQYRLELDGGGRVTFLGKKFVKSVGLKQGIIELAKVKQIVDALDAAGFFSLSGGNYDNCALFSTDSPSVNLEVEAEGKKASFVDYLGCRDRKWDALREVEKQIDEAVNVKQYLN